MKFGALVYRKCLSYTARHFPKLVKSRLGHLKMCKSVKSVGLNFLRKTYFHCIYFEEIKNSIETPPN